MNKIISLAAAGLCACTGLAQAQSSVSIYGFVDMGVTKANDGTSPNPGSGKTGQWNVQDANGSRLGFQGKEDLGGGQYARFRLEHRFDPDTGASAPTFWKGRSVVAVGSNSLGEVYLGRDYAPAFWIAIASDPTGLDYVSQGGQQYTYANYDVASATDGNAFRRNNTVGYKSPDLAGLKAELTTSAGEGVRKRAFGGNLVYEAGGAYLGVGTDYVDENNHLYLGAAAYKFGDWRPQISYATQKTAGVTSRSGIVALAVEFGPTRVYTLLGRYLSDVANTNATKFGLGTEYRLSKRTFVYANVGSAKAQNLTRSTAVDSGVNVSF